MAKKQEKPAKRRPVNDALDALFEQPAGRPRTKPVGRPPSGQSGAKVTSYPHQVSARIPGTPFHLLDAAAHVLRQPHWKIFTAAIEQYVESLKNDRDEITRSAKAAQARCDKCHR